MSGGEAKVEEELYRLATNVLESKSFVIEGVQFEQIHPQFRVDSGIADLMLPIRPSKPLLIIECKRKVEAGRASSKNFDPLSNRVITQALTYAVLSGASLFGTTNGKVFALFITPQRGESFSIERHRLYMKEIQLKIETVEEILTLVARWKSGISVAKTPLDIAFVLRLRSFVNYLAQELLPAIESKLEVDRVFRKNFEDFAQAVAGIPVSAYARESAYILMNKIIFYKILSRYYGKMSALRPMTGLDSDAYLARLNDYFSEAMRVTKDFEPVFSTGIYDEAPLPNEDIVLDEINSFIEEMDKYKLEEISSDIVGVIYEELIPADERHQLGQFYTPPQICELLTKWAIREPTDRVLDAASGSGTFTVKAYRVLKDKKAITGDAHKEILAQLSAIDINSFPGHLTAMNLAMRDVRHPTSDMNIVVEDFFNIAPNQKIMAPFRVRGASGEKPREIIIPKVDVVVANPPYTRWTQLTETSRNAIQRAIGPTIRQYKLTAGRVRSEPMIYVHFIIHATDFLTNGGRLAMIVSNNWLQTEYGIKLGAFLLDNFKVKAVIDFASRLFPVPLVATNVFLLEKESDPAKRNENDTVFLYVTENLDVKDILAMIDPQSKATKALKNTMRQGDIDRDRKWISAFFGGQRFEKTIGLSKYATQMSNLFEPLRGNTKWARWAVENGSRLDLGANDFFYLDKGTVAQWGLENQVVPALISGRYSKNFSYLKTDWTRLRDRDAKAYLLVVNAPRSSLPKRVREYIEWGETQCRTREGKLAPQSDACVERAQQRRVFKGWYDIGGIDPAPIFGTYYAQYRHRFGLATFPIALDTDILAFLPKKRMNAKHLKATLAYLNSTFFQLLIETSGPSKGGGLLGLEIGQAEKLPIINAGKISTTLLERLSSLFDELERNSRKIGGAERENKLRLLSPVYAQIDTEVARLFGFDTQDIDNVGNLVSLLRERRTSRSKEAEPEVLRGEDAPRIRLPRRISRRIEQAEPSARLDRWT